MTEQLAFKSGSGTGVAGGNTDAPLRGSAEAMALALRDGSTTSETLIRATLDRIARDDGEVHSFLSVDASAAIEAARAADRALSAGDDKGPLHGIPFAIKDIYDVEGQSTSCQSHIQSGHMADRDSAVVERLRAAGAILIGKLDTFEFALGGPSPDLPFPIARNPWKPGHESGGSSSGSAAAIGAGFVPLAPGTCTTGSIRGPAAWCGAVGLKPTFGRVSRRGVFPLAPSLDHCGPLARSVHDAAVALQVMAGHDPADPGSLDQPVPDYLTDLEKGVAGHTIGVPRDFFGSQATLDSDTRAAISRAEGLLRDAGATIVGVELPEYRLFAAAARIIMAAEAFAIHRENLRSRLHEYGNIAARRFAIGAGIGAADYIDARQLGARLRATVDNLFGSCDMMLTAISLSTAPPVASTSRPGVWPLQASPWNLTGHPAIAVPMGLAENGLPVSVQLVGPRWSEAAILRAARTLERTSGWAEVFLPFEPKDTRS
ncbi:aspartyl-tRNA(Asn)/glutamyl-tRNA(Gln) amidotransferase subunit A [Hoeflea marina]|uniref:Aspartyl-tRNA(Asn)/glutamyl-tRNA(Gln) amidotransferase subunit A n=1 Tax=Hoeflea marina TaxID=274592 RepID=A0A317PMF0_9HYPH|nr:amidase [Hoeflea marina]PWW01936.1 aspartyl-tRNA(Asn)/glutamyl-tRNA(Gln) amidotransferase subunit A [Hoeflea marina]